MLKKEDILGFYKRICYKTSEQLRHDWPHINVFERSSCKGAVPYSRRDYFKVTLLRGKGLLEYSDKAFKVTKPAVLFSSPSVPYHWQPGDGDQLGWFCIFNEAFALQQDAMLARLSVFQPGNEKLFYPDSRSEAAIAWFFERMMAENAGQYANKQDILRSYLHLIIHEVLKAEPAARAPVSHNASERIARQFMELLERQFPIEGVDNQLQLKTAGDFAENLAVHTNHLNRAVKEVMGETTTLLIARRIVVEATDLLRHSSLSVSEIAYALGFEYPAYFNNFYKKHTGITPRDARLKVLEQAHSLV
ncbi:MAG TPA: helix-turn-helix domain-containing protein [Chitinophagaceae bacterium]|nr:helix-turn-helix domain-containing protein [Chitinophagaceae bacterium]